MARIWFVGPMQTQYPALQSLTRENERNPFEIERDEQKRSETEEIGTGVPRLMYGCRENARRSVVS